MKLPRPNPKTRLISLGWLVASEIYKFLTSRQSVVLLGLGVVTSPLLAFVFAHLQTKKQETPTNGILFEALAISAMPYALVIAITSALNFSQELASSEIDLMRMVAPRRFQIALAKTFTNLLFAVLGSVIGLASSLLALRFRFGWSVNWPAETGDIWRYVFLQLASFALIALLASCLSFIARSPIEGTIHAVLLLLVLPSLLHFLPNPAFISLTSFAPIVCVQAIATAKGATPFTLQGIAASSLSSGQSLLVLLSWVFIYALIAGRFMLRESKRRNVKRQKSNAAWAYSANLTQLSKASKPFLSRLKSSLYVFGTDRLIQVFSASFIVISLAISIEQKISVLGHEFNGASPRTIALFEQSAYLTAPIQAQVLLIVFMGASMAIREYSWNFAQSQFLATPNRYRWVSARALAAVLGFMFLTLASIVLNLLVWLIDRNFEDFTQQESLNQIFWIVCHQVLAIGLSGLIAFSAGVLFVSAGVTLAFVSSLFILAPSVLQSLSDGFRQSGQQILSNLWTIFPVGFQAVRWLPEQSFMPQFLITGQLLINPSEELLIMTFWGVLVTALAFARVTNKSLKSYSL